MKNRILILGIAVLPFYDILMKLLPAEEVDLVDSRVHKAGLSLLLMLPFIALTLCKDGFRPLKNIWIAGMFLAIWASQLFGPTVYLPIDGIQMEAQWNYVAIAQISVYFLFFISIVSASRINMQKCLKWMVWVGGVMAIYVLLQAFGLDQFHHINPKDPNKGHVNQALLGGALGQPTLVSPFIAMLTPFAWRRNKYLWVLMVAAVFFTKSDVAIGALLIGWAFYGIDYLYRAYRNKGILVIAGVVCLSMVIFGGLNIDKIGQRSSGRFGVWETVIQEVTEPVYAGNQRVFPYTGKGVGSFKYLFTHKHSSTMHQAHSEPIEVLFGCGVAGLFFYVMLHLSVFKRYLLKMKKNIDNRALVSSFLIVSVAACGTFVYHLAVYGFFVALILGFIYRQGDHYDNLER